ncbi:MAG: hypothetical protein P8L66_06830 [Rhodospirillaceae bacterium]|nr:hypothetical protein [Rhodospirillaceae bacterium]
MRTADSVGVTEMCGGNQTENDLLKGAEQDLKDAIEQSRKRAVYATPPKRVLDDEPQDDPATVTPDPG